MTVIIAAWPMQLPLFWGKCCPDFSQCFRIFQCVWKSLFGTARAAVYYVQAPPPIFDVAPFLQNGLWGPIGGQAPMRIFWGPPRNFCSQMPNCLVSLHLCSLHLVSLLLVSLFLSPFILSPFIFPLPLSPFLLSPCHPVALFPKQAIVKGLQFFLKRGAFVLLEASGSLGLSLRLSLLPFICRLSMLTKLFGACGGVILGPLHAMTVSVRKRKKNRAGAADPHYAKWPSTHAKLEPIQRQIDPT